MTARAAAAWGWPALAVACGLVIAACFAPGLTAPFQMDDTICISSNTSIRSLARLGDVLFYPHQEGRPVDGRPLLNLSLAINRAAVGTSPAAFRSVNILLHWLAACLLLDVVRRLLALPTMPAIVQRRRSAIAFVAVLAWAVHPVQTAAVTYIIQRSEILAAIFLLAGLDLTVAGLLTGRKSLLPGVAASAATGAASKETIVSLPLVTLLVDRALIAESWWEVRRHRAWHLAAAAGWPVVMVMLTVWGGRGSSAGLGSASPWLYFLRQAEAIWIYLGRIAWPARLVFDYGDRLGSGLTTDWPWLAATTLLFLGVCVGFWRWPRIFLGPLLFFVLLGPTSSIIPVMTQTAGEHRVYLASAALIVPAIVGLAWLADRRRVPVWSQAAVAAIVLIALAGRTAARNIEYLSSDTIWRQSLAFDSANERAAINLATAALDNDSADEASRLLAGVNPCGRYRLAVLSNTARLAIKTGRLADAVAAYDAFLADKPDDAEIHAVRGSVHRRRGDLPAAAADVERALTLDAEVPIAWTTRGDLLIDAGKPAEAIACFQRSLAIDPDRWAAWSSLGVAFQQLGRTAEALAAFGRAIAVKPTEAEPYYNRGNLFAAENRLEQAAVDYGRALACDPSYLDAIHNRCVVLARLGNLEQARGDLKLFLRLGGRPSAALTELLAPESAGNGRSSGKSSGEEVVPQDAP
jgi:protein O-mannosyl-transferase